MSTLEHSPLDYTSDKAGKKECYTCVQWWGTRNPYGGEHLSEKAAAPHSTDSHPHLPTKGSSTLLSRKEP